MVVVVAVVVAVVVVAAVVVAVVVVLLVFQVERRSPFQTVAVVVFVVVLVVAVVVVAVVVVVVVVVRGCSFQSIQKVVVVVRAVVGVLVLVVVVLVVVVVFVVVAVVQRSTGLRSSMAPSEGESVSFPLFHSICFYYQLLPFSPSASQVSHQLVWAPAVLHQSFHPHSDQEAEHQAPLPCSVRY